MNQHGQFDLGANLKATFQVFGRQWLRFVLVAAVVMLPAIAIQFFVLEKNKAFEEQTLALETEMTDPADDEAAKEQLIDFLRLFGEYLAAVIGSQLFIMILQLLVTAVIVFGAFRDLRDRPVEIGECLKQALKKAPLLLGILVVTSIAYVVSMVLCCCLPIPVIFVFLYPLIPIAMIEDTGFGAFKRSFELTKTHFFPILAIALIFVIGFQMVTGGVGATLMVLAGDTAGVLSGWFLALFGSALLGISQAVTYHDLRVSREGIVDEDVEDIFD